MIEDCYDSYAYNNKTQFLFESIGNQGAVMKVILFSRMDGNRWNVGFGDVRGGKIDDTSFTNNNDVRKVIATVAQSIHAFSETYPSRVIVINPVDERRKHLYNIVFRRHFGQASLVFHVVGVRDENQETYSPEKIYDRFELTRKFGA